MNSQVLLRRLKQLVCSLAFLAFASAPSLVGAIDITVTGTADTADGPDTCAVAATVSCPSLRSAIRYANETSPDPDTITLSAGTYTLSIDGVDESWTGSGTEVDPYVAVITPDATIGDLDITDSLTITGAVDVDEKLLTTIAWDVQKNVADPALDLEQGDRIFHVQALTGTTVSVAFSNLILTNGSVGVIPNTNCEIADYPYDIEIVPAESCSIYQFRRFGGAIALGPGANIAFYVAAEHGPDTPGGGGKKPPDVGPGGDEPEEGGTISGATIYRVAVIDNAAGADAGGIYNAAPTTIEESVISGNFSGANGGGIYNDAELTINKTTIGTAASVPFIIDSALLANPNQGENGGGIFDTGFHTTTIANTSINGNTAIGGGGIAGRSLIVFNITNSTISGNIASDVGGGITTNGTINLNSSTVVNNEASTDAPGGGAGLNSFGAGTYNLNNTIVSNNLKNTTVDSNCGCSGGSETCPPGAIVSIGYNLESADTCGLALASDLINTDPQLLPLANNAGLTETHALQHTANGDSVDSPAVDTGDTANCPNNDQRGSIRPADGDITGGAECDIGAFELFVAAADLHFNNMTAPDQVDKGSSIAIQAEIHNPPTATVPATSISVATTFPAEFTAPAATFAIDAGASTACTTASNVVTCAIGTLNVNSTAVISLTATASTEGDYSISSQITATDDPDLTNNTASVSVTVIGNSDMQVVATPDQPNVDIGDNVTVSATLTNGGPDEATSVRVGTTIPDEVTLVSVTPSVGTCGAMDEDRAVACDIGPLASSGSATVTYVATVNDAGAISWSTETSADQNDPDSSNNASAATFTGVANADLGLDQSVSASTVNVNDNVTVTATLTNAGPQNATGASVTTTIPAEVTLVTVTPSAGICTAMDVNRNVTCNIGNIAASATATVSYVATVIDDGSIDWTLVASADQNDPDQNNNATVASFTGVANADLSVSRSVSAGSLDSGSTLGVWYTVANQGPQAATGVTLTVTLPGGWAQSNLSASQGSCSLAGSTLTCNIGDLAVDGDATVGIWGTVGSVVEVRFTADVSANENDSDTSNNSTSVSIKFEEEEDWFEELFGCSMSRGPVFDPTLLLVVIISLLHLARKERKVSAHRK